MKQTTAPFSGATTAYAQNVQEMKKIASDSKDEVEQRYRARIDEMQKNIDGLGAERDNLRTRLDQAEKNLLCSKSNPKIHPALWMDTSLKLAGRITRSILTLVKNTALFLE